MRKVAIACQQIGSRIIALVIIMVMLWVALRYLEWKSLYYPTRELEFTPADARLVYEDVYFVAEDGCKLHGWWIPHEIARGTVIMFHGNAGNIGDRIWMAADLNRLGLNCFLFDYRGYGKSGGISSEKGLYRDARAAYEVVRARYDDMENPPVILYGRSLGGAVAVQVALDKVVRALIIESTFTSTVAIGAEIYPGLPVRWFSRDRYDSLAKIGRIKVPTLIAHSRNDEMIPFKMGQELYAASGAEQKTFSELQGDHNTSGWHASASYWQALAYLVDQTLGTK